MIKNVSISIFGFIFVIFPELFNILSFIICITVLFFNLHLIKLQFKYIFLAVFFLFYLFIDFKNHILNIGSLIIDVIIFWGFINLDRLGIKNQFLGVFPKGILLGITFLASYSFLKATYIQDSTWMPYKATFMSQGEIQKFIPVDLQADYVVKSFGIQGSQKMKLIFDAKSSREISINLSLIQFGSNFRYDRLCVIRTIWTSCEIQGFFPHNFDTAGVFGSFKKQEWKKGSPSIQVRQLDIEYYSQRSIFDVFSKIPRTKGLAFNYNAFSALAVVVSLSVFLFIKNYKIIIFNVIPTLMCIFLSGTRTSFIAFILGILVFLLVKSQFFKLLPWFIVFTLLIFGIFQFRAIFIADKINLSQSDSRLLNLIDKNSARERIEIWRLAAKSWLESPQTFLIGVGNLTQAMKTHFDARSSRYGLVKNNLTHAHNLWLQTVGESGLFGLFAMIALWVWVVRKAWRSRDAGALSLLAAIFVINSVDYLFFYAPVHLAFWMAAAGFKNSDPEPLNLQNTQTITV